MNNNIDARKYERLTGYLQALMDSAQLAFAADQHELGMAILELSEAYQVALAEAACAE